MRKVLLSLVILLFLLAGCITVVSSNSKLTLSDKERWGFEVSFEVPSVQVELYGESVQQSLNQIIQDAKSKGLIGNWKQKDVNTQGNVEYSISLRGIGYDHLNSLFSGAFLIEKIDLNQKEVLQIKINFSEFLDSENSTFLVTGGRILSSNGVQIRNNAVRWINTESMEVVMEKPVSSLLVYILVAIGGLLCLISFTNMIGLFRKKVAPPPPGTAINTIYRGYTVPNQSENFEINVSKKSVTNPGFEQQAANFTCPNCGNPISSMMVFCSHCGYRMR